MILWTILRAILNTLMVDKKKLLWFVRVPLDIFENQASYTPSYSSNQENAVLANTRVSRLGCIQPFVILLKSKNIFFWKMKIDLWIV